MFADCGGSFLWHEKHLDWNSNSYCLCNNKNRMEHTNKMKKEDIKVIIRKTNVEIQELMDKMHVISPVANHWVDQFYKLLLVNIEENVTILVGIVGLGSLIGLVMIFVWLKKRLPRI